MSVKNVHPFLVLFFLVLISSSFHGAPESDDEKQIEKIITECYLQPLYGNGDLKEIQKGFHEEFSMYVLYQGKFYLRTRTEWIANITATRARNLPKKKWDWQFETIDSEGQTAVVKLRIFEDDKLKYVDYLTLYKFEQGWKVITKQFSMF